MIMSTCWATIKSLFKWLCFESFWHAFWVRWTAMDEQGFKITLKGLLSFTLIYALPNSYRIIYSFNIQKRKISIVMFSDI